MNKTNRPNRPTKIRELQCYHSDSTIWNDFVFRDGDIIVASYPKSGTTWVQQIVAQLVFKGDPNISIAEISPWLEMRMPAKEVKLNILEEQQHRRIIKTHLPLDCLTFSQKAKYIYVARDGRDVVWSFHNHQSKLNQLFYDSVNTSDLIGAPVEPPPKDIIQYWHNWLNEGGVHAWPYWINIKTWWDARGETNILIIHYNELKKNLPLVIKKLPFS